MREYLPLITAVSVAIIGSLLAPAIMARIKGKSDLETTERQEWQTERRERDQTRIAEIRNLKLLLTTTRESHDDLERRCLETERAVTALTGRVEQQDAVIVKQNGKLNDRDKEIAALKQQIADLRAELLEAYRRINNVQQAQQSGAS